MRCGVSTKRSVDSVARAVARVTPSTPFHASKLRARAGRRRGPSRVSAMPGVGAALDQPRRRPDLDRDEPRAAWRARRERRRSPSSLPRRARSASNAPVRCLDDADERPMRLGPDRRPQPPAGRGDACERHGPARDRRARATSSRPSPPAHSAARRRRRSIAARSRPSTVTPVTCSARPAPPRDAEDRIRVAALARRAPGTARAAPRRSTRTSDDEILAHGDVERNLERRLLALAAGERRPVALGEQRERERDREERRP